MVVEGDSSIVMNGLKTKEPSLSSYGLLISNACVFYILFSELFNPHVKRVVVTKLHFIWLN